MSTSFRVEPVQTTISDPSQPLRYKAIFAPRRSFKTTADFIIHKSGGGRWRFELALHALEPEVDGTLVIEAQVGNKGTLHVPISNSTTEPMPYKAFFTANSSLDLEVTPREGFLPADGARADLDVVFAAKTYGKTVTGTLIVVSPTEQWTFAVKGVQPSYKAPDKNTLQPSFMSNTAAAALRTSSGVPTRALSRGQSLAKSVKR